MTTNPSDFVSVFVVPDIGIDGELTPKTIVRCGFGPLVGWAEASESLPPKCPACDGDGTLTAEGANGKTYRLECPECFGSGEGDTEYESTIPGDGGGLDRHVRGRLPVALQARCFHCGV